MCNGICIYIQTDIHTDIYIYIYIYIYKSMYMLAFRMVEGFRGGGGGFEVSGP